MNKKVSSGLWFFAAVCCLATSIVFFMQSNLVQGITWLVVAIADVALGFLMNDKNGKTT